METLVKSNTEIASPFAEPPLTAYLNQRIASTYTKKLEEVWGGTFILHGKSAGTSAVRLDGNDYLGISGHPDIVASQIAALRRSDEAVIQSSVFLGLEHPTHTLGNPTWPRWIGKEDGFICQSGILRPTPGCCKRLPTPQTPVYIDSASRTPRSGKGCMRRARPRHPFRHNDPDASEPGHGTVTARVW